MLTDYLWLFATAGGAFLLGCALMYAVTKQKPLPPALKEAQERKIKKEYGRSSEDGTR
ncbi:hypothetical protein PYH37_002301 [Sinorhizobium numidicum]|uniref:Uncharacterized protein n=1 Tax=Sinorhizobium numidicum TaxID=680248 RepID=A0ABY8D3P4_9HYPH|nr:hypothetical protein [Sinorhizobium numidicum]WEX77500.1 hypothetical protein PYH37_002301 [Sinorhizobium numidicum]WEX84160.1 hypothetical protein PYH38_003014 [Sinorhizobium numidicum]